MSQRLSPAFTSTAGSRWRRCARLAVACGVLSLASAPIRAQVGDGIRLDSPALESGLSPWQARLMLGQTPNLNVLDPIDSGSPRIGALSVMGDYYFTGPLLGEGLRGGLRTTTGLLGGSRSTLMLGSGASFGGNLSGIALGQLRDPTASRWGLGSDNESNSWPYLGLGYTGIALRGSLSFSADVGLLANNPEALTKLRMQTGDTRRPSSDEVLHDLRLSPMFQIGVSYAF
jgi:hypothetical protein